MQDIQRLCGGHNFDANKQLKKRLDEVIPRRDTYSETLLSRQKGKSKKIELGRRRRTSRLAGFPCVRLKSFPSSFSLSLSFLAPERERVLSSAEGEKSVGSRASGPHSSAARTALARRRDLRHRRECANANKCGARVARLGHATSEDPRHHQAQRI